MELPKIYKRDVSGNIRVWWAETDDVCNWRTHSGVLDGEIISSEWRYVVAKSQSNQREQALFEAKAAMEKKLKLDYRPTIAQINEQRNSIIKPMLAHTYEGWAGRCWSQPKLDGMRCLATPDGLWSRNNRKIVSAPHIEKALREFFERHPNVILDGEIYNHEFHDNFNMIMSLVRKTKLSLADFAASERYLQYHIYDIYDQDQPEMIYGNRKIMLGSFVPNMAPLKFVMTKRIDAEEELDFHFIDLLKQGYEGQMVRYDRPYDQKRSPFLLKRKEFIDEEFVLIDIEEGDGNWAGFAKRAICAFSLGPSGRRFAAGISGTQQFCENLLRNKSAYKSVTVKYHALTPDGIPRFPIAIKFWPNEFSELEQRTKPQIKKDLF